MPEENLLLKIEQKRAELIQIVLKNGLNSESTIRESQILDSLLNQYNNRTKHKSLSNT